MPSEHVDVLIVGAGLSGVGAACHLEAEAPGRTYAILEARDAIGGTWDLFRYPGIRSDSDMFTLGYDFRPWEEGKAIADGPSIRHYVQATARDHGVEGNIRFHHRVRPRRVVERGRALDGRRRAHRHRGHGPAHLLVPVRVHRLLPLRRGLPAALRGPRAVRGADRPPPALARGARLRRQARGRDRQRRDRGDARAGDGRARGARDDAAALAELRGHAAGGGPDLELPAARAPLEGRLRGHSLEERAPDDGELQPEPREAGADEEDHPPRRAQPPAGRLRGRPPLQAELQPVGAAALPRAGQRPVRGDLGRRGICRHRRDRDLHGDGA